MKDLYMAIFQKKQATNLRHYRRKIMDKILIADDEAEIRSLLRLSMTVWPVLTLQSINSTRVIM